MSKPAFTAGPYVVSELYLKHGYSDNDGSIAVMTVAGDDGCARPICRVAPQAKPKRGTGHAFVCVERDANAHLIASAPDMYEALLQCREYLKHCLGSTSDINPYPAIDAALAKAEGRS